MYLTEARPRPISFGGCCTPSVKKLDRMPLVACLMALVSMPSISLGELLVGKDSEVFCVVFRFDELFCHECFVERA